MFYENYENGTCNSVNATFTKFRAEISELAFYSTTKQGTVPQNETTRVNFDFDYGDRPVYYNDTKTNGTSPSNSSSYANSSSLASSKVEYSKSYGFRLNDDILVNISVSDDGSFLQ